MIDITTPVQAANWLMLQGTEPADAPRAKVWGLMQPTYFATDGSKLPVGSWAGQDPIFNVHQPDLSSNKVFQIQRLRLAVRGANFPLDSKINYFFMAEFGNNGITQPGGDGGATLTDAAVTFNHIKGARVRVGQMKIPMSEEVYQGIFTLNYINMTNMANLQLIERPFWTDGTQPCMLSGRPGGTSTLDDNASDQLYLNYCHGDLQTQFRTGAVAVRDIGIQVFDTFKVDDWEHSYALLYGQGGIKRDNREDEFDTTVYWSSEKIYGGKGPLRTGLKLFAWRTSGKRALYDSALLHAGATSLEAATWQYDRKRSGIGLTYWGGKYRVWAEYIKADGMIFNGTTGGAVPGAITNDGLEVSQFLQSASAESDGWYIDFGYRLTPKVQFDYRYDIYNHVTNLGAAAERTFETHTLGAQYFFNKKTRFIFNYEFRSLEAPGQASTETANLIGDVIDDRISAQVLALF